MALERGRPRPLTSCPKSSRKDVRDFGSASPWFAAGGGPRCDRSGWAAIPTWPSVASSGGDICVHLCHVRRKGVVPHRAQMDAGSRGRRAEGAHEATPVGGTRLQSEVLPPSCRPRALTRRHERPASMQLRAKWQRHPAAGRNPARAGTALPPFCWGCGKGHEGCVPHVRDAVPGHEACVPPGTAAVPGGSPMRV